MSDKHVHVKNRYIKKARELAEKLLDISLSGTRDAKDDSSLIFFGTLRDYAYRIRRLADELLEKKKGGD